MLIIADGFSLEMVLQSGGQVEVWLTSSLYTSEIKETCSSILNEEIVVSDILVLMSSTRNSFQNLEIV